MVAKRLISLQRSLLLYVSKLFFAVLRDAVHVLSGVFHFEVCAEMGVDFYPAPMGKEHWVNRSLYVLS